MNAFAQLHHVGTWGLGEFLVAIVVIAALLAVVYKILAYLEFPIPAVAVQIFWIVVCAALAIWAIRFLLSL